MTKVHFTVKIEDNLGDYSLLIDQHKLEQVIRNFIGNAVKFTPQYGSIDVIACIKTEELENGTVAKLRFEVQDSGAGISEANLKSLFGQYIQFNANKLQAGKGSGLGLWSK